jgi:CubicO group peptidase (beta-lactamase class C family)
MMHLRPAEVHGHAEPGLEPLRDALGDVVGTGFEVGAALAVHVGKQRVVDLWAGHADAARTRPWQPGTLVNLYSVGKAIMAICALRLVDAGALDLSSPVARYWPEFAQGGKQHLPVRQLLTHQAGLPAVDAELPAGTELDWQAMTQALAAQAPWWEPGTAHGYHVNTVGYLVGEVVRRVTGRTLGAYLREEIARPGDRSAPTPVCSPASAGGAVGAPPATEGTMLSVSPALTGVCSRWR